MKKKKHVPSVGQLQRSLDRNNGKICKAEGCYQPRYRISTWCSHHGHLVYLHGHPQGCYLAPTAYKEETLDVSKFIDAHIDHQGIQQACTWIREWLEASKQVDSEAVAAKDMSRLAHRGVDPVDILKAAASIWLYSVRYPLRLPDDQRLTYQISIAVLKTAPRDTYMAYSSGRTYGVRYSAAGKKAIGKRIRDTLGLLLENISVTIEALPDTKEQLKHYLSLPFDVSPTLLLNTSIPEKLTYIPAPLD